MASQGSPRTRLPWEATSEKVRCWQEHWRRVPSEGRDLYTPILLVLTGRVEVLAGVDTERRVLRWVYVAGHGHDPHHRVLLCLRSRTRVRSEQSRVCAPDQSWARCSYGLVGSTRQSRQGWMAVCGRYWHRTALLGGRSLLGARTGQPTSGHHTDWRGHGLALLLATAQLRP